MASSGINYYNQPRYLADALLQEQLDYDLSEYYKVLAILHGVSGDAGKANKCLTSLLGLLVPEMGNIEEMANARIAKEMEDMDKWVLRIDLSSLPKPTGLVRRKKPERPKAKLK